MTDIAEGRLRGRSGSMLVDKVLSILATRPATIDQLMLLTTCDSKAIGLVLDELSAAGRVEQCEAGAYRESAFGPVDWDQGDVETEYWRRLALFPLPHQLDGDWRFTFEAASDLVRMMGFALASASRICCLGTPSIATLLDIHRVRCSVFLVDYNVGVLDAVRNTCESVQCIHLDIMKHPHVEQLGPFDVVFADPPWAGEYCQHFAKASVRLLADGGFGCLVYFPSYLRDSAPQRQVEVVATLVKMNARIITLLPERVTILDLLRSTCLAGRTHSVTHTGGKGAVCVFEKVRRRSQPNDPGWDLPWRGRWVHFHIGQSKWMLRVDACGTIECESRQLKRLDVNSEFTRYNRDADQVGLWTSGGQVFSVSCTDVLAILLQGMSNSQSFDDLREDLERIVAAGLSLGTCQRLWVQLQEIKQREDEIAKQVMTGDSEVVAVFETE
ncbi:hypothetical protein [Geomonas oryzae]|uniref:hypothetical protein n=1 Tax=Geomonas oryzae TaxID=2364273 RepID=UPI0013A5EB87|nr:hypothetical protein [Geomonas oryzae]